jgi:CheY-like chemotaxis protein
VLARPDVVICDLGLPGMDGFELARALRSDPAMRGLRLWALTGYGHEEQRSRAAGFERHLTKPLDTGLLARLLGSVVVGAEEPARAQAGAA